MPAQDRCANYNAFGYDSKGQKAYLSSLFYGPDWVPKFTPQQFGGPPEPPRFGPAARYQRSCLPKGWIPRPPRDLYNIGEPFPPFLKPPTPEEYNPEWCAALLCSTRFLNASEDSDSDESDIPTSPVVPYLDDVEMSDADDDEDRMEVAVKDDPLADTAVTEDASGKDTDEMEGMEGMDTASVNVPNLKEERGDIKIEI